MPRVVQTSSADGSEEPEVLDFIKGTRVKVAGLAPFKKGVEVRPLRLTSEYYAALLGGKSGAVAGFDESRGRWVVDFGDGLGKKLFFEDNLEVVGAENPSAPEPSPATVPEPAPATVQVAKPLPFREDGGFADEDSDDEVADIFEGARVRITGLTASHAHLNGKTGIIKSFVEDKKRWCVVMDDGLGKKMFKEANLASVAAPVVAQEDAEQAESELAPAAKAPASQDRPPPPPGARLRPGAQALIDGLPAPHDHLNGQVGVCENCDYMSGMWTVTFANSVEKIRPEFMTIQASTVRNGAYIRVKGTERSRKLNGLRGIVLGLEAEGLWNVAMENGERISLGPENLDPLNDYNAPGTGHDEVSDAFAQCLESGEISWLDC